MWIERVFQALAVILAVSAAYLLWVGNHDWAFVAAVLGSLSYFLSVRFQVKARNEIREAERRAEMDAAENALNEQTEATASPDR